MRILQAAAIGEVESIGRAVLIEVQGAGIGQIGMGIAGDEIGRLRHLRGKGDKSIRIAAVLGTERHSVELVAGDIDPEAAPALRIRTNRIADRRAGNRANKRTDKAANARQDGCADHAAD